MSENKTTINWFPGHMTKAKRMMEENLQLIDLVIELVDARVPLSSRNPDIDKMAANKYRIVLLNKSDLADPKVNREWISFFENQGCIVSEINSKSGAGVKNIQALVQAACKEKIERNLKRGIKNRPIRAMIVGIPNVGKSTFINAFVGKAATKTGNKPGVTKGKQWITKGKDLQLLDTPGILWPKFEDQEVGRRLAFIGSINDEIIFTDELACDLLEYLIRLYPDTINERYGIEVSGQKPIEILKEIALARKAHLKGEEPDINKAAGFLIDDFRSGRLGRISLERPLN
ncbi:MAG: ribosome biogenesis GTPase YlqF [Lachnospiraceae bacterium]|nr:ribosome biogenesis GTPase YlqF [Lachnospiraceae bacterium]